MKLQHKQDGNHFVITKGSFIDLQESPAVFIPVESRPGKDILHSNSVFGMQLRDFIPSIFLLFRGGGTYNPKE